jgi:hypothetical protein
MSGVDVFLFGFREWARAPFRILNCDQSCDPVVDVSVFTQTVSSDGRMSAAVRDTICGKVGACATRNNRIDRESMDLPFALLFSDHLFFTSILPQSEQRLRPLWPMARM